MPGYDIIVIGSILVDLALDGATSHGIDKSRLEFTDGSTRRRAHMNPFSPRTLPLYE